MTVEYDSDNAVMSVVYNDEGASLDNTTYLPALDTWFFCAMTHNGTNVAMHIKKIGDVALTSFTASNGTDNFTPNSLYTPQGPHNYGLTNEVPVRITDLKIWASVLTNPQILTESKNYNTQAASPWGFYKFINAATATTDSSGNARTLTSHGAITDQTDPAGVWDDVGSTGLAWIRA